MCQKYSAKPAWDAHPSNGFFIKLLLSYLHFISYKVYFHMSFWRILNVSTKYTCLHPMARVHVRTAEVPKARPQPSLCFATATAWRSASTRKLQTEKKIFLTPFVFDCVPSLQPFPFDAVGYGSAGFCQPETHKVFQCTPIQPSKQKTLSYK